MEDVWQASARLTDSDLTCCRSLDAESIFWNACSSFRQSLSEYDRGEFREYENAESLVSDLQLLAESHPVHKSRLVAFVRKLHYFVRRFEPYFEIVNIYVETKPDFSAAIWGSLRVLFKACLRASRERLGIIPNVI